MTSTLMTVRKKANNSLSKENIYITLTLNKYFKSVTNI